MLVPETPPEFDPDGRRPLVDLFPPAVDPHESAPAAKPRAVADPSPPRVDTARPSFVSPQPPPTAVAEAIEPHHAFYGLVENPFSLSTDPKFLYHSAAHDRTAQALLTSIGQREGVVVITGPVGIGKTSLCRAVIEELDRHTLTSFLVDPFLSVEDLLETLLIDFGVLSRDDLTPGSHPSTHQLRVTLQSFLRSLASLQASAVVLIDEAQNLPVTVLEELRTLAEVGDAQRLLHVVLVGDPELQSLLQRRELRPLNERIAVRSALGPLSAEELDGYVTHRLSVSGSPSVEFSDAALARIYTITGGVPRLVNLLGDRILARGYDMSATLIDAAIVDIAAADLGLSAPGREPARGLRLALTIFAFVFLMVLGAAAAAWVFRDEVRRAIIQWQHRSSTAAEPLSPRTELPPPHR